MKVLTCVTSPLERKAWVVTTTGMVLSLEAVGYSDEISLEEVLSGGNIPDHLPQRRALYTDEKDLNL